MRVCVCVSESESESVCVCVCACLSVAGGHLSNVPGLSSTPVTMFSRWSKV